MSRATRTAEPRRGSFGNLIPFALGVPVALGLLHAISTGLIPSPELQRYTQFPVQKLAVILFCCAMTGLFGKLLWALRERAAGLRPPLPEWDGKAMPLSEVGALQQQMALQSA